MAPQKKKPVPLKEPAGKEYGTHRMLDRTSFIIGAVGGALIIALIVLAYVSTQQAQREISAAQSQAPAPAPEPEKEKPAQGLHFSITNNQKSILNITYSQAGGQLVNLTGLIMPGETKDATVAPLNGCGSSPCQGQFLITYIAPDSGSGIPAGSGQNGSGVGAFPGANETADNQSSGTGDLGGSGSPYASYFGITTAMLQNATLGTNYQAQLAATGGTGSYTWYASGLPPGMAFSPSGMLSGTPLVVGSFDMQITITDGISTSTQYIEISVK